MTDLPEPMTPPDCDLRGMPYMPVDVVRLFDSDLYALASGDEFKAAFTLWGRAFLQVPAGSLPDDDRILAHLSGAGPRWTKLKAMALRGWVKCSDGRLYHTVVAEKASDAWTARLAQRARTEAARAAKAAKKDAPPASDSGAANTVTRIPTKPVAVPVTDNVTRSVTDVATGSKGREGKGREEEEHPSPPSEGRSPRGGRLPDDWHPSTAERSFAEELGLNAFAVADRFRDHWRAQPGAKGRKSDWPATWRNWCRRDAERPQRDGKPSKIGWLIEDMRSEGSA